MKKLSRQILSAFCALVVLFGMCNIVAYAEDGYFVLLDIMGYDETGTEITDANNVFYVRNDTLYAPISVFEDYTMYNYDEENTAFVRVGQEYERANSKVVFNYESATIDIYYLTYQKETLDLDFYQFGDLYFFPLGEMAAYLKSSVVYKSNDTISIVSSGISISDALYNYNPINSCLDYSDLRDDIFAGDEGLYKSACVLGYVGETIFSFKVTNLMGSYGEKEKYVDILESAVTNNEPYEQLLNNDSLLADFLGITEELYNDVYKKATKTYKLSANALTTMFEDYKSMHSFGDASPFENFFPEEQAEIDKINSFSQYIDTVGVFVDAVDFYYKFYTMNQDHKDAIELFSDSSDYDMRAIALSEIADLYGNEVVESAMTQLGEEIEKELLDEALDIAAKEFMSGANKVKLATGIVDAVFNAAGFDLSDNSGYDVMLASQLKHFVLNSVDDSAENLLTQDDCNKMRLTQILGMLIDIQSYKMGNKFAAKYSSEGIYDDELDEANKRIALFYLAKDSEKYDCVEGTQQIADQNKKQIKQIKSSDLSQITMDEACSLIYSDLADVDAQNNLNAQSVICTDGESYYFFASEIIDGTARAGSIIRENISSGEQENLYNSESALTSLSICGEYLYFIESENIIRINKNGLNKQVLYDFDAWARYIIYNNRLYCCGWDNDFDQKGYVSGVLTSIDLGGDVTKSSALFYYGSAYYRHGVDTESQLSQITVIESIVIVNDQLYFLWDTSMNRKYGIGSVSLNTNTHDASNFTFNYWNIDQGPIGNEMQYYNNCLYLANGSYFNIKQNTWNAFFSTAQNPSIVIVDFQVFDNCIYFFERKIIMGFDLATGQKICNIPYSQILQETDEDQYGYIVDSIVYNDACIIHIGKTQYRVSGDGFTYDGTKGEYEKIIRLEKVV